MFPLPETKTEKSQHIASEWHHHVILKAFNLFVATIWWDLKFDESTSPTAKVIKMLKKKENSKTCFSQLQSQIHVQMVRFNLGLTITSSLMSAAKPKS